MKVNARINQKIANGRKALRQSSLRVHSAQQLTSLFLASYIYFPTAAKGIMTNMKLGTTEKH